MAIEASGGRLLLSGAQWPQQAEAEHLGSASEGLNHRGIKVGLRTTDGALAQD